MNDNNNIAAKKPQAHKICAIAFLWASITTAVLAFTLSYNAETGYLNSSFSATLLTIIVVSELVAAAIVALKTPATVSCTSKTSNVIALILHVAVTYCGAMAIIRENAMIFPLNNNAVTAIKAVFSIAIMLAFLTNPAICKRKEELSVTEIINSCSIVVFCLCAISLLYFDLSVEMNNPSKLYLHITLFSEGKV